MKYVSESREWVHSIEGQLIKWKNYFPKYLDPLGFGIELFYSPYYMAEEDSFPVRFKGGDSLGWLIPLSYLQENDEVFISQHQEWLNRYAYVGIALLMSHILANEKSLVPDIEDECYLSDKDLPACHVLVYDKSKLSRQKLRSSLYRLYDRGFYHVDSLSAKANNSYYKSEYAKKIKDDDDEKTSITLSLSDLPTDLDNLLQNLYEKWLPYSYVNSFSRYIYLYQVVEYFMEESFEESLYSYVKDFNDRRISKNDLREKINSSSREDAKIESVFSHISSSSPVVNDFKHNVDSFMSIIGIEFDGTTVGQYVYKMRNVLVHNMRRAIDHEQELDEVVECFEKLIAMRLDCEKSKDKDKHMVVCDISEECQDNIMRMKRVYKKYKAEEHG